MVGLLSFFIDDPEDTESVRAQEDRQEHHLIRAVTEGLAREVEELDSTLTQLHYEMKKMEKRETMYMEPRLLETMHKGEENKKYWRDTIRHHDQKKISFFVTNILATKRVSVPIRWSNPNPHIHYHPTRSYLLPPTTAFPKYKQY